MSDLLLLPQHDYPKSGFDTDWELAADGPLPRPVWMMDNRHVGGSKVYDAAGSSSATLENGADWQATQLGSAVRINNPNECCALGSIAFNGLSGVSLALLYRVTSGTWGNSATYFNNGSSGDALILNSVNEGTCKPKFLARQGWSGGESVACATDIQGDGKWHLVVGTCDATATKIYLDGELADSGAGDAITSLSFPSAYIIGRPNAANCWGDYAFVAIWGVSLTASQVASLRKSVLNGGPGLLARSTAPLYFPTASGSTPSSYTPMQFQMC